MELFGRELTTEEIINFVRMQAPITRKHRDCRDCLFIDMALALADEIKKLKNQLAESQRREQAADSGERDGDEE